MAAITFHAVREKARFQDQLKAAVAGFREMLDVFVSNRMQRAAAEAEYVRAQRQLAAPLQPDSTP